VVAFRFSDAFQKKYPEIEQKWIQTLLRVKGWIVPNYELPPTLANVQILRVVVKEHVLEPVGYHLDLSMYTYQSLVARGQTPFGYSKFHPM